MRPIFRDTPLWTFLLWRCKSVDKTLSFSAMWTVISRTRKAIPGLAKILLAVFLLGSLGFAVYVQHLKKSFLKPDLDTPIQLRTDSGVISLMLSSRWEKMAESQSPIGRMEIRSIPGSSAQETAGFFYLNLMPKQLVPESQFLLLARQNGWVGHIRSLKMTQNTQSTIAFPNFEAVALYLESGRSMILVSRMIYLPNGMTLSMTFITSPQGPIHSDYWLEELAQTVQFTPGDQLHQVRRDQTQDISLGGITLQIPEDLWVLREADGGSLYLQPAGKASTDHWQARIKPMFLPAFREPEAVLNDFFFDPFESEQRIVFPEPVRMGDFMLYQANLDSPRQSTDDELSRQHYGYLLHRADGLAILTTLETMPESQKKARDTVRRILTHIKVPAQTPATSAATQPAIKTFLSPAVVADQAEALGGWFLIKQNDIRIGFEAVLVTAMPGASDPEMSVVSYFFFDTDLLGYQEDTRWRMTTDLMRANYESHVKTQFSLDGRSIHHVLIHRHEAGPATLQLKVKLNRDITTQEFSRPDDFLPGGSEQILINQMARETWTGPDSIQISQCSDFQARLETMQIRRGRAGDGPRRVFVSTDHQSQFTTHLFDENGRWLGRYNPNGFSITRSSPEEIQRFYPKLFVLARQRLELLAGGERPDRENE